MGRKMSRRNLLKGFLAGLSGSAALLVADKARAESQFGCSISGNGWDQWNRTPLLNEVMKVVNASFLNPAIEANAKEQGGNNHFLTDELVRATAEDMYPGSPDYSAVLWCQLSALRNAATKPQVIIKSAYRQDQTKFA